MITLQQIADMAGVSRMTVSNVINGKHSKVSREKETLINQLVEEYHYVPNLSARSLANNHSKMIAIIIDTFSLDINIFKDPYFGDLFGEIETAVRSAGFYTIVQTVDKLDDAISLFNNWRVDGAIFLTAQSKKNIKYLLSLNICPMVFLDSYCSGIDECISVNLDDFKGGYIATKHLLTNGHRKIAFAGSYSSENDVVIARYKGYLHALEEFALSERDAYLINTFTTYDDGIRIGRELANGKHDVTAVFATSDHLASGLVKGCMLNGYNVPRDVSIVGFDNLNICTFLSPALTTVSQNVHYKAQSAVDLLIKAIRKEELPPLPVICDVELKIRQTVARI